MRPLLLATKGVVASPIGSLGILILLMATSFDTFTFWLLWFLFTSHAVSLCRWTTKMVSLGAFCPPPYLQTLSPQQPSQTLPDQWSPSCLVVVMLQSWFRSDPWWECLSDTLNFDLLHRPIVLGVLGLWCTRHYGLSFCIIHRGDEFDILFEFL